MIKVRRNVFETNSSSMHSLSVIGSDRMSTLTSKDGIIVVGEGEFGWGYDTLKTPSEKLSYLVTEYSGREEMIDLIKEAVKDYTGMTLAVYENEGYIDHESQGMITDYITDKQSIIDIVFNDKNVIIIDNDNH
jgi:hypothetical protein